MWNKQRLLHFVLSYIWNKQNSLCFDLSSYWISRVRFVLIFLLYGISRVRIASIFLRSSWVSRVRFASIFKKFGITNVRFTSILTLLVQRWSSQTWWAQSHGQAFQPSAFYTREACCQLVTNANRILRRIRYKWMRPGFCPDLREYFHRACCDV